MFSNIINLIYPNQCFSCGKNLLNNEEIICLECLFHLPKTHDYRDRNNSIMKLFHGRVTIEMGSSFLFFTKSGRVQHLIHQLKYNKKPDIGLFLGKLHAQELVHNACFADIDLIIPVPLHPKRKAIRGFNQSEMIALGLSQTLFIPMDTFSFIRKTETQTQTKKDRFERWHNVKDVFSVENAEALKNKHLLLVDDVITTGSTLEGCIRKLLDVEGVRVSVACLAIPNH